MAAQPPPYAYPVDPSTGYPTAPQQQPGYPDPAVQQGYPPQTDVKPYQPSVGVDAYGQPIPAGGYPQQPPSYQPYPTGYTAQQQTTTAVVVAQQPAVVAHVSPGIRPNNYLVLSIINLLFCFFILGLIALIFSLQVDSAWSSGNYEEARRQSNVAKVLNYIGIGIGIAGWVIVGIIVVLRIALAAAFAA